MEMLAAMLQAPHELELCERTKPHAGPGEVVLKVKASTLCGTDYRLFIGVKTAGVRYEVVPGHEFVGRIVDVGEGVDTIQPGLTLGQQAMVSIVVSCGRCQDCLHDQEHLCFHLELFGYAIDGGLQEYLVVSRRAVMRGNLITTNQEFSPKALYLAEPASCCLNTLDHFQAKPGDVVAVLGTSPIGLFHAQLALACGARRVYVSSRSEGRRAVADRLGAVEVAPEELSPQVKAATAGAGAGVVVVCIGASELAQSALELAAIGGRMNFFAGFPRGSSTMMEPNLIRYRELQVTGGSNARRRDTKYAIALLELGATNVAEIVTHEFPPSRTAGAYETMNQRVGVEIAVIPD